MQINIAALFAVPALIWGSTFFVIKYQLGEVPPSWSVSYRFILAGLILLAFARLKKLSLSFSFDQHRWIALQGLLLFAINYWLVYLAEEVLVSALVAIAFSCIIFLNILFGRIFLSRPINHRVFVGALLGVAGTVVLFYRELGRLEVSDLPLFHLSVCFISVVVASLGNITSARNQLKGLPVIQTNAYGMLYGGIIMGIISLINGETIMLSFAPSYLGSLLYLSVFGSIIAFTAYLTLIGKAGADRAAYVLVVLPFIAVILSILFEGYELGWPVVLGIALVLLGNVIVLKKRAS